MAHRASAATNRDTRSIWPLPGLVLSGVSAPWHLPDRPADVVRLILLNMGRGKTVRMVPSFPLREQWK